MKKCLATGLLVACLSVMACQNMDRAAEQDLSETSPDATLPPSVPTDTANTVQPTEPPDTSTTPTLETGTPAT